MELVYSVEVPETEDAENVLAYFGTLIQTFDNIVSLASFGFDTLEKKAAIIPGEKEGE